MTISRHVSHITLHDHFSAIYITSILLINLSRLQTAVENMAYILYRPGPLAEVVPFACLALTLSEDCASDARRTASYLRTSISITIDINIKNRIKLLLISVLS